MAGHAHDIHITLVERCRTGDRKAQYELYRLYSRAMYNICLRILNHVGEAEDVLQESFLYAYNNLGHLRADVTFGVWLKRIVVTRSINALKKRKLQLVEDLPESEDVAYEEQGADPYDVQRVMAAMQQLPDGYRIVLSLYLLEGYDHGEIAGILGIAEGTSKSQYNRAKAKLKTILNREQ